jgi:biopolymer transport protein ExbB
MQAELILHSLDIISQGGLVSIAVAATLSAMSIASWTLMATKAIQIRRVRGSGRQFITHLWEALSTTDHVHRTTFSSGVAALPSASTCGLGDMQSAIKTAINRHPKSAENPFVRLALQGLNAADHHNRHVTQRPDEVRSYDEFIAQSLRRGIDHEAIQLETGLTLLASVGSIAPFVGLFGTVWGIYHALGAIAVGGQATVDKVAGPVGEALIMTAFGLAVAMPAVLAYNTLVRDNRLLIVEIENFAHDLHTYLTTGVPLISKQTANISQPNKQARAVFS